ncbi:hypothetical protein ACVFI8_20620 [Agarivorans sp. MS3-6]|uniref:hypothetical protein n=1 Tax=Agarivorans sp. TSD2052 TaxID=2937286 RepID=UPI00200FB77E|nr:hypothetical protein [Agarivorans sp. TSD2052]UPW16761.1 hypothetical protein M0C34_10925 [Agarivorans sp. TSD2052]
MKKAVCLGMGVLMLSACVPVPQQSEAERSAQKHRDTVIVSAEPGFSLTKAQTVCSHPLLQDALRSPQRSDVQAYDVIHQALNEKFTSLGLTYLETADERCDYWMAFALPTSQKLSDEQLMSLFGVSPGLADDGDEDFQRATLMMSLYTAQTNYKMWQVSLQAFAKVETDDAGRRNIALQPEGVEYAMQRIFSYLDVKDQPAG